MSAREGSQAQCNICDGVFGHKPHCQRYTPPRAAAAAATEDERCYRYRGRVYRIVIQARSPSGPVTLETIDEPRETVETTNDRMTMSAFERV